MNTLAIETAALHLPATDRAKLAHKLLESLDVLSEAEIEALWLGEAEKRLAEIQSGAVQTISAEQFAEQVEALFK